MAHVVLYPEVDTPIDREVGLFEEHSTVLVYAYVGHEEADAHLFGREAV